MKKHLLLFCILPALSLVSASAKASVERHALETKATNEPDAFAWPSADIAADVAADAAGTPPVK